MINRGDVETIRTLVENGVDCSRGDYDKRTVIPRQRKILYKKLSNGPSFQFSSTDSAWIFYDESRPVLVIQHCMLSEWTYLSSAYGCSLHVSGSRHKELFVWQAAHLAASNGMMSVLDYLISKVHRGNPCLHLINLRFSCLIDMAELFSADKTLRWHIHMYSHLNILQFWTLWTQSFLLCICNIESELSDAYYRQGVEINPVDRMGGTPTEVSKELSNDIWFTYPAQYSIIGHLHSTSLFTINISNWVDPSSLLNCVSNETLQDAKRHGKTAAMALLETNGGLLVSDPRLAAVKQVAMIEMALHY